VTFAPNQNRRALLRGGSLVAMSLPLAEADMGSMPAMAGNCSIRASRGGWRDEQIPQFLLVGVGDAISQPIPDTVAGTLTAEWEKPRLVEFLLHHLFHRSLYPHDPRVALWLAAVQVAERWRRAQARAICRQRSMASSVSGTSGRGDRIRCVRACGDWPPRSGGRRRMTLAR